MKHSVLFIFLLSSSYLTAQKVGVNKTNPEFTLDVRSTSIGEPSQFNISNLDKSRYVRFFSGSDAFPDPSMSWNPGDNFLFATFDDVTLEFKEYMRISSTGEVGIGIPNPTAQLDVKGGDWNLEAGSPGDLRIGNATNNFRIGIATGGGGAGITRMYTNSNSLLLGTNNLPSLTIDQDQNVGIGTTSPNTKLQITGGSDASDSNGSGYLVLGSESGLNVVFDNNEIIARNNAGSSGLYVQQTGGLTSFGGEVTVSGTVSTPSIDNNIIDAADSKILVTKEYTEAKYAKRTKEIVIPSIAFQPTENINPVSSIITSPTSRYISSTNGFLYFAHETGRFSAPLTLPVGSVISEISTYVFDDSPLNIEIKLIATNLTSNIATTIFTLTSDNSSNNQVLTHTTPLTILTDYMYFIVVEPAQTEWGSYAIKGTKIIYTE
ncbi:MAG: hypothetical protein HKN68_00240 [Saprospiraceae bacterium]|nr:hypothetical protein [Saprospiraceae bacterium]